MDEHFRKSVTDSAMCSAMSTHTLSHHATCNSVAKSLQKGITTNNQTVIDVCKLDICWMFTLRGYMVFFRNPENNPISNLRFTWHTKYQLFRTHNIPIYADPRPTGNTNEHFEFRDEATSSHVDSLRRDNNVHVTEHIIITVNMVLNNHDDFACACG